MPRRGAQALIDRLLALRRSEDLVALMDYVSRSPCYAQGDIQYGLPEPAFVLLETHRWFTHSLRTGLLSYIETVPLPRQEAMLSALKNHAPPGFALWYSRSMGDWRDDDCVFAVDAWLMNHEDDAHDWMWDHADRCREALIGLHQV